MKAVMRLSMIVCGFVISMGFCQVLNASTNPEIYSPDHASYNKGIVYVKGSVALQAGQHYTATVERVGGPVMDLQIPDPNAPVNNGTLAVWDTCAQNGAGERLYPDGHEYVITIEIAGTRLTSGRYVYVDNYSQEPSIDKLMSVASGPGTTSNIYITVKDPDDPATAGGSVTVSASNLPSCASFFPADRRLEITRSNTDENIYAGIVFTATDDIHTFTVSINLYPIIELSRAPSQGVINAGFYPYSTHLLCDRTFNVGSATYYSTDQVRLSDMGFEKNIFTDTVSRYDKYFNGTRLYYTGSYLVGSWYKTDIRTYDVATGIESVVIPVDWDSRYSPSVSGKYLVWLQTSGLFLYDMTTGTKECLFQCQPQGFEVTPPVHIWGDKICFSQTISGLYGEDAILLYDLALKGTGADPLKKIGSAARDDGFVKRGPKIYWHSSGDIIVEYNIETGVMTEHKNYYQDNINRIYTREMHDDKIISSVTTNMKSMMSCYDISRQEMCLVAGIDDYPRALFLNDELIWCDRVSNSEPHIYNIVKSKIKRLPYISGINPQSVNTGDTLVITGEDFGDTQMSGDNVVFEKNVTGIIVSWSDSEIVFTVPELAVSGQVKVSTAAGISTGVCVDICNADMEPPTQCAISIESGIAYVYSTQVRLDITAQDSGSGMGSMMFTNDQGNWPSAWEPYAISKTWTLTEGEGIKTVYAKFRDNAGNISQVCSDEIFLDTQKPVGQIRVNYGEAYTNNTSVTLNLTAEDSGSGLFKMQFSNDDVKWTQFVYASSAPWTIPAGDGPKTVYAYFQDKAGRMSVKCSYTITLDTQAPMGEIGVENGAQYTFDTSVTLNLLAEDMTGEVLAMQFSNNMASWSEWEEYETAKEWTIPGGDGPKTVYARFRDKANNISGACSDSIILATVPASPTRLSALAYNPRIVELTWIHDLKGKDLRFELERKTGQSGEWAEVSDFAATRETRKNDSTVSEGEEYYYRLRAYTPAGRSSYSNEARVITPLNAPTNLSATAISPSTVRLAWINQSNGATGFIVERREGFIWTRVKEVNATGVNITCDDTSARGDNTYYYRVQACNTLARSAYSPQRRVQTPPQIRPNAPINLVATFASSNAIGMRWTDKSNNEESFVIQISTNNVVFRDIGYKDADVTSYTSDRLARRTWYFYRVRAHNSAGDSEYSNTIRVMTR